MLRSRFGALAVVGLLAACGGDETSNNPPALAATLTSLTVTATTSSIVKGATLQLTAMGHYDDKSTQDLSATATWTSSSTTVATVSATGLVTGAANGAATISATVGSVRGGLAVTVVDHVADAVITAIAVTPADQTVGLDATLQLTATATYSDASSKDITTDAIWQSGDDGIAHVSGGGLVTGTALGGPILITASLDGVGGSTHVTVNGIGVASTTPPAGARSVRNNVSMSVAFSAPISQSSISVQAASGACSGSIQLSCDGFATCVGLSAPAYNGAGDTVTVTPATPLPAFATCQVREKSGITSGDGASLASDVTQSPGFTVATDGQCAAALVISQVYGGGGATGATYDRDFIELHNGGATAASLAGVSVQYAGATAATWTAITLPNVSVPAGGYFLIGGASGSAGAALPTPDAGSSIDFATAAGKVALVAGTAALSGTCPLKQTLDFVGYGAANCSEGTVTAAPSETDSVARAGGCQDTNANATDFASGTASANNSASGAAVCECTASGGAAEIDTCTLQTPGPLTAAAGATTDPITVEVLETGLTESTGASSQITAQVGAGASASDPTAGGWTWSAAAYNSQNGDADDYTGTLVAPTPAGDYSYAGRATRDGVNWTYCDLDGNGASGGTFDTAQMGTLTAN